MSLTLQERQERESKRAAAKQRRHKELRESLAQALEVLQGRLVLQKPVEFESKDLNAIMAWYLAGDVSMAELADALNERLAEKRR